MTTYIVSDGRSTEVSSEEDHEDSSEEAVLFFARNNMNPDNRFEQKMTVTVSYDDPTIGTRTEIFYLRARVEISILGRR